MDSLERKKIYAEGTDKGKMLGAFIGCLLGISFTIFVFVFL